MQNLWARLERFFAEQGWHVVLRPGASEAEITQVEQALGLRFPDNLRASLYIHDGEDWQEGIRWLDNSMLLLPVTEILAHWNLQQTYYARWGEDEYADEMGADVLYQLGFKAETETITLIVDTLELTQVDPAECPGLSLARDFSWWDEGDIQQAVVYQKANDGQDYWQILWYSEATGYAYYLEYSL